MFNHVYKPPLFDMLTKTMELNNLIRENLLNLTQIYYYLLIAYVNIACVDNVYFKTSHRNGLIYI